MAAFRNDSTIVRLVRSLRKKGLDDAADRLEQLSQGIAESLNGGSWLERNSGRFRAIFDRHVANASTELVETAQLLKVARKLLVERKAVSHDEMEAARNQLVDLLKTVPASAIFAGTFLIPVPGAQPILAPVLMERLGLLPSAWSESKMESELRDLIHTARKAHLQAEAEELERLLARVRKHQKKISSLRKYVEENPDWAVFFDETLDSRISDDDLSLLRRRIKDAARVAAASPEEPLWTVYFRGDKGEDKVRGPLSYAEIRTAFPDARHALIRQGSDDWWVPLWAVTEELG
jgi:hypothetical protein